MICNYGCGQKAIHQFKNGKWCCSKLSVHCPSIVIERSKKIKKTANTQEHKNKMSIIIKEKWKDPNHIYNNKDHQLKRNKILSKAHSKPESKKLQSKRMKQQWNNKNSKLDTKEVKHKKSIAMKNKWKSLTEEEREIWKHKCKKGWTKEVKESFSKTSIKRWTNEEYRKKLKESRHNSPNKTELKLFKIINEIKPDRFKFVGDFDFFINGKNPDFIDHKNKQIIELFGSYWHSKKFTGIAENIHEQERINHFKNNGYNCLVIWDLELKNINNIKQKLIKYLGG
jgi:hypothetical protein